MQIYKCDICKAEIQGSRTSVLICNLDERGNITFSRSVGIDACPGCADKLAERIVLTQPCEVKEAEEDEQESKPADVEQDPEEKSSDLQKPQMPLKRSGGRRKLDFDLGKAISLRRGGWPISKIAAEMGCAPQTVANYLERAHVIKKKVNADAGNTADV